jgi:hypothetical protein
MSLCLRDVEAEDDEARIRATFERFDSLTEVQIASNGERRDAFVMFRDTREAVQAFEHAATNTVYRKKRGKLVLERESTN